MAALPETLYHVTTADALGRLCTDGIRPTPSGTVYFVADPSVWSSSEQVVLAVPYGALVAAGVSVEPFCGTCTHPETDVPDSGEYLCFGTIPPELLRLYDRETGLTVPLCQSVGIGVGVRSVRNDVPVSISRPVADVPSAIPLTGTADDYDPYDLFPDTPED